MGTTVFELIEQQQKGKEDTAAWMVGEQLKEICRSSFEAAELVEKDLANADMSIAKAEVKIKAWADERHKSGKGSCVAVPPNVAEQIIREFYGLPSAEAKATPKPKNAEADIIDLADFL